MANNWKEFTIEELQARKKGAIAMGPFGSRIKAENFVDSGVPIIKGAQLHGTFLNDVSFDYLTQEKADELSSSKAYRGDIVITHRGTIGQVSVIPFNSKFETYIVSQSQLKVSLNTDLVNPYFVAYFLNSHLGQHRLLANASQVGVPAIAKASTSVKQILVPVPELDLQNQIVKNLLNIDNKIDLNHQTNQTLEQMAQALFKSWFVDFDPVIDNALAAGNDIPEAMQHKAEQRKQAHLLTDFNPLPDDIRALFPSEFEQADEPNIGISGWIPKGWKVKTIGSINKINPESWTKKNAPESVKYVDLANAKNGSILDTVDYTFEEAPSRARRVLKKHDIIIGVVRPPNRSFAYVNENGLTGSTGFAVVRALHESYRAFTYLSLTNDDCITEFARIADGAAYPAIKPEDVTNALCIYSSDEILKRFEDLAGKFLLKKAANERQMKPLAEVRDALLPKFISGEINIRKEAYV